MPYTLRGTTYPLSLKDAGAALGLEKQKLEEGKELIRYFCVPCNPTKTNGGRTRNLPVHAKEKWELFVSYNKRDVEVELQIQNKLSFNPVPDSVWDEYHIDHGINGHLRQKGKIAELALGYGGGAGALKAMGALSMGLQEEELQPLVD